MRKAHFELGMTLLLSLVCSLCFYLSPFFHEMLLGVRFLTLSDFPFRQPAGYIPPSHAALGEAHLCDLY